MKEKETTRYVIVVVVVAAAAVGDAGAMSGRELGPLRKWRRYVCS